MLYNKIQNYTVFDEYYYRKCKYTMTKVDNTVLKYGNISRN